MKTLHQSVLRLSILFSIAMFGFKGPAHIQPLQPLQPQKALARFVKPDDGPILTVATQRGVPGENKVGLGGQGVLTATSTFTAFLPAVALASGDIYGRITLKGQSAANETLNLYAVCTVAGIGRVYSLRAQATTDEQGNYHFVDLPSVPYFLTRIDCTGYQAFYGDGLSQGPAPSYPIGPWVISHPGRIYALSTRILPQYTAGTSTELENFDIDALVPTTNISETVALPTTFGWLSRSTTPDESYEMWLFDYDCTVTCIATFTSGNLGHADHFVLNSVPAGYLKNTPYDWFIKATLPTGGTAYSPYLQVTFK